MLNECQILLDDFLKLDESFLNRIKNVLIVENEMVYLTFPQFKDSICIWGQGYKVNILNGIEWFKSKGLYYFGDLDEHGFDILSTYRRYYPQIQSFCMDKNVLEEYEQFLVQGKKLENERITENLNETEKMGLRADGRCAFADSICCTASGCTRSRIFCAENPRIRA